MKRSKGIGEKAAIGQQVGGVRTRWSRCSSLMVVAFCFVLAFCASFALADESSGPAPGSQAADEEVHSGLQSAIEAGNPQTSEALVSAALTDPGAAQELPHRELDRSEALELMRQVFGAEVQAPAGIFDELEVERFLSNYAAVIPAGSRPAPGGVVVGGDEAAPQESHATLLESTTPLRAPDVLGREQPVDLSLEPGEEDLSPANPLVEVGVPQELGEGIELPEAGVQIELAGAPQERAPSTMDQSVAAYPEVARDTTLAVAPTPTGVETLTLLQSADAPHSETFHLDLPAGATLQPSEAGGAEVVSGEETTLVVEPPTAIDAEGQSVPVSLEVSGEALTLRVSPGESAAFPILVDPVYDTFNWNGVTTTAASWVNVSYGGGAITVSKSASCSNTPGAPNQCGTPLTQNTPGLYANVGAGAAVNANSWGQSTYFVPRAGSDYSTYGTLPSSFIESMTINHMGFWHRSDASVSPFLAAGIWSGAEAPVPGANPAGWASVMTWGANQGDLNEVLQYTFPGNNNHNAKEALVGMVATQAHTMTAYRDALFREVTISVGDVDKPGFGSISSPSGWVDQTASPVGFTVSDSGLGVSSLTTTDRQTPQHSWTTSAGCAGTNDNPCPHTWKSTDAGRPALKYEPSVLPTGVDMLDVTATDPVGNLSTSSAVQVKVDHTAPTVSLSGTMTEQATLGTSRPRYAIKATALDGTEASPQSGVASVKISVDGKQVQLTQPGCSTQNCQLSSEWTLNASSYSVGQHTVAVTATDAVGRSTTKEITIQIQPDTTKPTFGLAGEVQAAPSSWVQQRNYTLIVSASDKGYGVTKVQFLVDGKAITGGTAEQSCVNGGCALNHTYSINMANFSGGEHAGTVVVTDGAGNKAELSNPFRVDPSGTVSAAEAAHTLEAAENTTEETPVAPTAQLLEPEQMADGDNPGLGTISGSNALISTGVSDTTVVGAKTSEGFTVGGNDGTIQVAPVKEVGGTAPSITGSVAAVSANVESGVDTVVRPEFDGALTFQTIRQATSPESFSWHVNVSSNQKLVADDLRHAEVDYEDGSEAFLITAETAHDATGASVPTKLTVEGSTLTLVVEHHSGTFVYPIVAGQGYETSYNSPVISAAPEAAPEREAREKEEEEARLKFEKEIRQIEQEGREELEALEREQQEHFAHSSHLTRAQAERMTKADEGTYGIPAPSFPEGATDSKVRTFQIYANVCQIDHCAEWEAELYNASYIRRYESVEWEPGSQVHAHVDSDWPYNWVIQHQTWNCGWVGPAKVVKESHEHLIAYQHFTIWAFFWDDNIFEGNFALQDWVFPNGYQERHVMGWSGEPVNEICG